MNTIIIYGSFYGTTKQYAVELSKQIGCLAVAYHDVKRRDLSNYSSVIHLGGLYAGGVLGLKETVKQLSSNHKLIIGTVGLSDVTVQSNTDSIKRSIQRQLSQEMYDKANLVHLRGGIDYSKLNFKHRTMMKLLMQKVKQKPESKRNSEENEFLATFDQSISFVDYKYLNELIRLLKHDS